MNVIVEMQFQRDSEIKKNKTTTIEQVKIFLNLILTL